MTADYKTRVVEPDLTVVEISGRLGLGATGQSIEWKLQKLVEEGAKKVVIDVAQLESIDSAGVGMLIMVAGQLKEKGGTLRIAGPKGHVARTFELVHLPKVVPVFPDAATACEEFPG